MPIKLGLQQVYGKDTYGRNLKMFTVHSLRHSHIMHYVVNRKPPLFICSLQLRPQFAPCPGQRLVLYNSDDNIVVGGTISVESAPHFPEETK
jgi:hypothetical protein